MLSDRLRITFLLFVAPKMAIRGQLERPFVRIDIHISHQHHKILILVLIPLQKCRNLFDQSLSLFQSHLNRQLTFQFLARLHI